MAKLTADQVTELKTKGFITQVVASSELANNSVDELKIEKYITDVVSSEDIENALSSNDSNDDSGNDPAPDKPVGN